MDALLNQIFPTPENLGPRLKEAREFNSKCIAHLESTLAERRRPRSELQAAAPDLAAELEQLQRQAEKMQELGTQTQENVYAVTREIKKLDATKENLVSSIRMLRQLKILTKLYLQLDILLKERRYEDMSGVVRAASDLTDYFRPFRPLPQISKLSQEIGEMETKTYKQIEQDFAAVVDTGSASASGTGTGTGTAGVNAGVADPALCLSACRVLDTLDDALGQPANRTRLIEWYCGAMLREYEQIFSPRDEAGSLENVGRRYTYLKNKVILRFVASHQQLFPPEWPVKERLIARSGERTAADLLAQLPAVNSSDSEQIQTLLTAIYETVEFENYVKTPRLLSPQLLPYLSVWVDFQNHQITQRVLGYSRALVPPQPADAVVPSSRELVQFYRALLQQLAQIGQHEHRTVTQLAEVLALHLGKYAQRVLMAYLPENSVHSNEELCTLRIVNATSDYIMTTTAQLERTLRAQLDDDAQSREAVDDIFETSTLALYRQVTIRCENLMVQYIQRNLEPMFIEMAQQYTNASRSGAMDVSRVSPYTQQVIECLLTMLQLCTAERAPVPAPSPSVISTVYSKTTDIISSGFLTMAMARVVKPISESIVEQMLLDLGAIKNQGLLRSLAEIPDEIKRDRVGGSRLERLQPKILERIGQAEAVLKVLHTPAEPMETFIRNYQVLVKDRSTLNFRKILDVKGVRFQPRAMEKFKLMASQEPSLAPENLMLRSTPTVPPAYEGQVSSSQGFGFKRIGDFLRRDH